MRCRNQDISELLPKFCGEIVEIIVQNRTKTSNQRARQACLPDWHVSFGGVYNVTKLGLLTDWCWILMVPTFYWHRCAPVTGVSHQPKWQFLVRRQADDWRCWGFLWTKKFFSTVSKIARPGKCLEDRPPCPRHAIFRNQGTPNPQCQQNFSQTCHFSSGMSCGNRHQETWCVFWWRHATFPCASLQPLLFTFWKLLSRLRLCVKVQKNHILSHPLQNKIFSFPFVPETYDPFAPFRIVLVQPSLKCKQHALA